MIQALIDSDRECPETILKNLETCFGKRNRMPELEELIDDILVPLMSIFTLQILCVDGIEHCSYEEQQKLWNGLRRISRTKHFKLLVACEDETKIPEFSTSPILRIRLDHGPVSKDIEAFVEARLFELSGPDQLFYSEELRERVKSELLTRSEGMQVCFCSFGGDSANL